MITVYYANPVANIAIPLGMSLLMSEMKAQTVCDKQTVQTKKTLCRLYSTIPSLVYLECYAQK